MTNDIYDRAVGGQFFVSLKLMIAKKVIKKKICKSCQAEFTPQKSTQIVCSVGCSFKYAAEKKQQKILKDWNKEKKIRLQNMMTIPQLIAIAEREVNEFIRIRDLGKTCVSCNTILTKQVKYDAGHFYATNYSNVRFNYTNIHGQCVHCNQHKHSNPHEYRARILDRISQEELNWLDENARKSIKWDRESLLKVIEDVKLLKKEIKLRG